MKKLLCVLLAFIILCGWGASKLIRVSFTFDNDSWTVVGIEKSDVDDYALCLHLVKESDVDMKFTDNLQSMWFYTNDTDIGIGDRFEFSKKEYKHEHKRVYNNIHLPDYMSPCRHVSKTETVINGVRQEYDGCAEGDLNKAKEFFKEWVYIGDSKIVYIDDRKINLDCVHHFFVKGK